MPPTPPRLNTHQKQVLIQVLLAFPGQRVAITYSPAPGAFEYAHDFLAIFQALQWDVTGPDKADSPDDHATGLIIVADPNAALPASAEALRDALRVYSVEVTTQRVANRSIPAGGFLLAIP